MARMTWPTAWLAAVLALGGLGCGRTELILAGANTETGSEGSTASTGGTTGHDTGRLDTGGFDTGRPTTGFDSGSFDTGRPTTGHDSGGPITVTATFTTGFDTGVPDSGFDSMPESGFEETGFPGTTSGPSTTSGSETSTTTTTTTNGSDTDGGTTSVGTTDGGTTDGGSTSMGTTDGGTTDGGGTTGGDPTCLDAVDCVIACGGASPACIGQSNDGLSPGDNAAFNDLEGCIIFACIFNGACGFGGFDSPECIACRIDGQLDPALLDCDDEAMSCL
jgi:hypothetical protein